MGELQLIQQQREKILSVAGEHGMVNVRLFGSVARGEETPESDIDFLVDLEAGRSLLDLGGSTIAHAVEERLHELGRLTYVFDGDNVRHGLCRDLGFGPEDRAENLRRISEMVRLFLDAGIICLTAFISPLKVDRQRCRELIDCGRFFEIYVKCPLEVCEQRDVKGLYKPGPRGQNQKLHRGVGSL